MKKRYVILTLILITIFAIWLIGFLTIQLDPAREIYQEGQRLQQMFEYDLALEKFQRILDEYPDSIYASKAFDSINECYLEWAEKLEDEKDYESALEKYQTVIDRSPESRCAEDAGKAIPECCYEWGLYLQSEKRYSEALEKYQLVIDNFSNQPYEPLEYTSKAEEAIPECYHEWISQLITDKRYDDAVEKYCIIIESYADSVWASREKADVLAEIPVENLFNWSSQLQQQKLYDSALRLYEVIIEYYPDSVYATEAEKAKIDIEIAKIAEEKHGELPPPPEPTQKELEGKVELTIVNDTPYTLTFLLSGPTTMSVSIEPSPGSHEYYFSPLFGPPKGAEKETITIESGTYKLVARVDKPTVIPYYGEEAFDGDKEYSYWLYILTTFK